MKTSSYDYVECRALGHSWDQIPSTRRPSWGILLTFRCVRCTTTREDTIDQLGDLSTRRYVKPEGYAIGRDHGSEPPRRNDWRRQLVKRHSTMVTRGTGKKR